MVDPGSLVVPAEGLDGHHGVGWGTNVAIRARLETGFISAPFSLDSAPAATAPRPRTEPPLPRSGSKGDRFRGNATTLQLDGARELDRLSKAGLPVVLVRRSNAKVALAQAGADARSRLVAGMLAHGAPQGRCADTAPGARRPQRGPGRRARPVHADARAPVRPAFPREAPRPAVACCLANARPTENRKITRIRPRSSG